MRHGKLFDRNFALLRSTTNLIFIGAFQPQLNRFFDHRFRVFRCFSLADDAQLGTVCNIPTVLPKFDNSGESLGSFTSKKVRYSALCANSAKGGWQQRQVVEDSEIKCGNWQTCQTYTCRDVSSHDYLKREREQNKVWYHHC